MLELGKYAVPILSAYGIAIVLIGLLVLVTWRQSVKAKADLEAAEARKAKNG